ncbi:hypothetical protein GCM10010441_44910 [Kitasatospora paracochleata]|uniref:HNH endonuclease n=1 Tax=Kitasatospora paracochleata TaxID=58354 RepID=A0ABT1JAH3_9ACTN|nr:hypothetical protein [Kitasatospora paracochleata]MCP2314068.1 hypothetical protein [Kitasatospora paracochleata]
MSEPTEQPSLHDRIADALRAAARDCTNGGNCSLSDRERLAHHPVQIDAWYDAGTPIDAVSGNVGCR